MVELYFSFYNGFSGQIFYATVLGLLFNAAWTSWPCLFSNSLDRVVEKETIYARPGLYQTGPTNSWFNGSKFFGGVALCCNGQFEEKAR